MCKVRCDALLLNSAFKSNLRRYSTTEPGTSDWCLAVTTVTGALTLWHIRVSTPPPPSDPAPTPDPAPAPATAPEAPATDPDAPSTEPAAAAALGEQSAPAPSPAAAATPAPAPGPPADAPAPAPAAAATEVTLLGVHHLKHGRAVQVDPMTPKLKLPGPERLKLKQAETPSNFAFKFNLRHYSTAEAASPPRPSTATARSSRRAPATGGAWCGAPARGRCSAHRPRWGVPQLEARVEHAWLQC